MLFYFKSPVGDDRAWVVVVAGPGRVVPDGKCLGTKTNDVHMHWRSINNMRPRGNDNSGQSRGGGEGPRCREVYRKGVYLTDFHESPAVVRRSGMVY